MPLALPKARADLEFFDQVMEGEEVVIVRDPIRNTYSKYNELQAAMLRLLDGTRTIDEMVTILSERYEVEIPRAAAERFVAHARKQMLLDVASYGVSEQQAQAKVLKTLRKQGFTFRTEKATTGLSNRVISAEAVLFMGGIRQLQCGEPAKALDYFNAVLELNPQNARAKQLVDTIQSAYIKALSGRTSDFPSFVLFNPMRLLTWLNRVIGRFVFHPGFVVALLAYIAVALYCYSITPSPDLDVGAFDIVILVLLYVVNGFFHELAHGFACAHYGGRVPEIGVMLMMYIEPAPYCDTSASYLFKSRTHQMIVQLAGSIMTVVFLCTLAVIMSVVQPDIFFFQAGRMMLVVAVVQSTANFMPLLKFDGYYGLCELLGIPNLRERSLKLYKAFWAEKLLGVPATYEDLTPAKRRIFFLFGAASSTFTVWWLYHIVFTLLAPACEHFHGILFVLAAFGAIYLVRRSVLRPVIVLARFVWKERRRVFTWRRGPVLVAVVALAVVPWTLERPVVVDADFILVPKQRVEVRARVAGLLAEVRVAEGQRVARGDTLATLRNDDVELDVSRAEAAVAEAEAKLAEVTAGARPEEIQLARQQVALAAARHAGALTKATNASALADAGMGGIDKATAAASEAAVSGSLASASGWKLAKLTAGSRPEEIAAATAVRDQFVARLDYARAQRDLLTIRSPIDGVVATPRLSDRMYSRVEVGDTLLEVHDTSAYVAEIHVPSNAPLDQFHVGDEVVLVALGAPDQDVTARVEKIQTSATVAAETAKTAHSSGERKSGSAARDVDPDELLMTSSPFNASLAIAGLAGHARIYGEERSLAYSRLYWPLVRITRVGVWSHL